VALAHTVLDMSYNEADLAKAIASGVDGVYLRPVLPAAGAGVGLPGLSQLIERCWSPEAAARPSFDAVETLLDAMAGDSFRTSARPTLNLLIRLLLLLCASV
jgi:hypothetical protein